jgi:hypothetical protein
MATQPKLGVAILFIYLFIIIIIILTLVAMIIGIGLCESGIRFVSGRHYNNFKCASCDNFID